MLGDMKKVRSCMTLLQLEDESCSSEPRTGRRSYESDPEYHELLVK
jgi:hypothetical protein